MEKNSQLTRKKIMDAASELFSLYDANEVKIKDICQKAGCSESTFYYQFENKEKLLLTLYSDREIVTGSRIGELFSIEGAWNRLWAVHEFYIKDYYDRGVTACGNMISTMVKRSGYKIHFNNVFVESLMIPLIEQAQKAGEILNQSSAEEIMYAVCVASFGVEVAWGACDGEDDIFEISRRTYEALYQVRQDLRRY